MAIVSEFSTILTPHEAVPGCYVCGVFCGGGSCSGRLDSEGHGGGVNGRVAKKKKKLRQLSH